MRFSSPKEEYDTLLPFICGGLNCGQRAFHVPPSQHREDHLEQLCKAGIDVEAAQRTRQLEVALPEDTYLKGGRFNKDAMLALIQEALKAGTALGFPLTRMVAHAEGGRLVQCQRMGRVRDASERRAAALRRPRHLHL
jgi:hypothetical protein